MRASSSPPPRRVSRLVWAVTALMAAPTTAFTTTLSRPRNLSPFVGSRTRPATTTTASTTTRSLFSWAPRASTTRPPSSTRLALSGSSSTTNNNPALALYERYQDSLPSPRVIEACDGQKAMIASDLAASAGISVAEAQRQLTLLASLSQGSIAVSQDGDLIYGFPRDLAGVLASQSRQFALQQQFQNLWPALFWGIRVSFGVALVASLVAIYSTIFFIQTSSSEGNDDRRDDRRGSNMSFGGSWFWGPSPLDFFYYRPYGYYGYYGTSTVDPPQDPENLGFFESVYSYVFGDGNPNTGLEQRRLSLAAQMIRQHQGAVTAEQLAPYANPEKSPDEVLSSNYVDESFVLPIVTQLNGQPTVTDDGDIVYLFPELQTTAASSPTQRQSSSSSATSRSSDALILKRAGLTANASPRDIQRMLNYNGISTKGAYEKQDLMRLLDRALPPLSREEEAALTAQADADDPTLLAEREIPFSVATDFNKLLAGGLGVVNLVGALYLGQQLGQITAAGYALPGIYGTIAGAYPLLLGYGILFNVIPLIRNFVIKRQNAKIQARNSLRKQWRSALKRGAGRVKAKLQAAKSMALRQNRLGSSKQDILYDSASTTMEQLGQQKEKSELSAFDELLSADETGAQKKTLESEADGGAFQ